MKKIFCFLPMIGLAGCVTLSGDYVVSAYDAQGKLLTGNLTLLAYGSGIYSIRNSLCSAHPKATVIIKDRVSGQELTSESPYQCR